MMQSNGHRQVEETADTGRTAPHHGASMEQHSCPAVFGVGLYLLLAPRPCRQPPGPRVRSACPIGRYTTRAA